MATVLAAIEGKYEIVSKLKEGGMGAIYKVRHRLLDEERVVKMLRPQHEDDEELRARFVREARSAIRLRHPNVVQLFDFSVDDAGTGLIVMEYIHGADLGQLIEQKRLPSLPLALEIARQGLRSLGFLHRHGFVHRDVSPDNLMLTLDVDRRPLVKLIDLGITKRRDAEQRLTTSGSFLGKFRYASPEHFGSAGPDGVEERSDLYTFGVVFYQLLTGRYPLPGESTSQLIGSHLFQSPLGFDVADPDGRVPEAVRRMVLRALEKKPDDRFADADAWIAEIEAVQRDHPLGPEAVDEARALAEELVHAAPPSPPGSTQHRFDAAFGRETTPAPRPDEATVVSGEAEMPPLDATQVDDDALGDAAGVDRAPLDALVAGAEALYQLGQVEQARQQLSTVLSLDPAHRGARELRARIRGGPTPEPASEATPGPTSEATPAPTPEPREEPREEPARDDLARQLRQLLADADAHVDAGDYPAALELLRRAQAMAPEDGDLRRELTRGVVELHRKVEAREQRHAIAQIEAHVRELVREGRLDQARGELVHAEGTYGRHDVFDTLGRQLERASEERQGELVKEAGLALEAGRLADAVSCLEKALALDPDNDWIQKQLAKVRAQHEEEAEAERQRLRQEQERRTELAAVSTLLEDGEHTAAAAQIEEAADRWGDDAVEELRRRLARARRERARELVADAEAARAGDDLLKARLLAAEAREVAPDASFVESFVKLLDLAVEEMGGDDDPLSVEDAAGWLAVVGDIERLRVEGHPLTAWKAVQHALRRFGQVEALLELRRDLADELLADDEPADDSANEPA